MKDGVINDLAMTEAMLTHFIAKTGGRRGPLRPRLMVAVPSGINEVEKGAVTNSAMKAGAREVYLIKEPLAAAIGAGLPVADPVASMIVDIGGGTSEVAVISLAGIVVSESVRCAGNEFDHTIVTHVKQTYGVAIGENTAEQIKVQIGCATAPEGEVKMTVRGRDLRSGMPTEVTLTAAEIAEALAPRVATIVQAVKMVLERTAPELSSDLLDRGIVMAGGSSQLRGLGERIASETGLPVRLAEDPMTCVARGCAALLDNLDRVKDILEPGTRS
jgi:rod shape-determining protein MreB